MSKHIELQKVFLHGVIFKMRRDDIGVDVVRRVLHRAEIPDLILLRDDDKAAWVLARRAAHIDAARCKTVLLRAADGQVSLGQIFFHIAVGRFLCDRTDRARTEHMARAEHFDAVLVGARLVFARKVQVDIRDLVTAEAEERLKRDVEAVLIELRAALRANGVRQVGPAVDAIRNVEGAVFAFGAAIMRRQRVDLGDAGHEGHERRANGAAGSDEVAVLQRILYELLCRHVNDVVMAVDNVSQLGLNTFRNDLGRIIAVQAVQLAVDQRFQVLDGVLDLRRKQVMRYGADGFAHVGDVVRVLHNDLIGLFRALEHLVRRAEIERIFAVAVLKALRGQQDAAIDLVLRVQEVDVSRRADRLSQLLAQPDNGAVELAQLLVALRDTLGQHEAVVAQGLDLKEIVERRNAFELRVALVGHNGLEQLACLAGRADNETLTESDKL